jgi:hypothetical protein
MHAVVLNTVDYGASCCSVNLLSWEERGMDFTLDGQSLPLIPLGASVSEKFRWEKSSRGVSPRPPNPSNTVVARVGGLHVRPESVGVVSRSRAILCRPWQTPFVRFVLISNHCTPCAVPGTSMATFSSNGPTWDGRIKPDVLAPGWTLSAQSRQSEESDDAFHCHVSDSVGSMVRLILSRFPGSAGSLLAAFNPRWGRIHPSANHNRVP